MFNSSTKFNEGNNNFKSYSKENNDIVVKVISPTKNIPNLKINTSGDDIKKKPSLNSNHSPLQISSNTPTFQNKNISYNLNKSNSRSFDFSKNYSYISASSNNSSQTSTLLVSNQIILDEINDSFPDIVLEETEGDLLNGKKIVIHPKGLSNSPRNFGDGFVFFGENYENEKQEIINDVILNIDSDKINNQNSPSTTNNIITTNDHFFVIYFNLTKKSYFIRPYTNNHLSFIIMKLESSYKIHSREYIVLSDYVFSIYIDAKNNNTLTISKIPTKKSSDEAIYKYKIDYGPITIGRDRNCSISFPSNKAFSKVNTTINYSKSKGGWIVNDGGESPSTNGTWIMLRHSFELNDGCEFKTITNSKFKIEFAQKSKIISVNNNNIE